MAEGTGLLRGLQQATALGITHLKVEGDSHLLIKQLNGQNKVNNAALKELHALFQTHTARLSSVTFSHIYREFNKEADKMANRAMDTRQDGEEYVSSSAADGEECVGAVAEAGTSVGNNSGGGGGGGDGSSSSSGGGSQ